MERGRGKGWEKWPYGGGPEAGGQSGAQNMPSGGRTEAERMRREDRHSPAAAEKKEGGLPALPEEGGNKRLGTRLGGQGAENGTEEMADEQQRRRRIFWMVLDYTWTAHLIGYCPVWDL